MAAAVQAVAGLSDSGHEWLPHSRATRPLVARMKMLQQSPTTGCSATARCKTVWWRIRLRASWVLLGALLAASTAFSAESSAETGSTSRRLAAPADLILPLEPGRWTLTSGPHGKEGYGQGALDFQPVDKSWSEARVVAIADGTAQWLPCRNNTAATPGLLVVDHGTGWWSTYFHVVSIRSDLDAAGETVDVERGEPIAGLIGPHPSDLGANESCGGTSTGPHLHFALGFKETGTPTLGELFRTTENGGVLLTPFDYRIGGWTAKSAGRGGAIIHENGDIVGQWGHIDVPSLDNSAARVDDPAPEPNDPYGQSFLGRLAGALARMMQAIAELLLPW